MAGHVRIAFLNISTLVVLHQSLYLHNSNFSFNMAAQLQVAGGLVEIAALTALVGATTAESLVLGDRGAAGMPWAAMSSFGSLFLVKACLAASIPGWLRNTLGVSDAICDHAIGHSLVLAPGGKWRTGVDDAIGVSVRISRVCFYLDFTCRVLNRAAVATWRKGDV